MSILHELRRLVVLLSVWTWALVLVGEARADNHAPTTTDRAAVVVGERTLLEFSEPLRGVPARERAAQANKVLATAAASPQPEEIRQRAEANAIVVYIGDRPAFTLTVEDARAEAYDSLQVYADAVCVTLTEAIAAEQQRARIAKRAFSLSLVVFFGLIAMLLLRRIGELGARARTWAEERGDTLTLRILQFELVRPEMVQSTAVIAVTLFSWLIRLAVAYAWLALTLSMFDATRGYTGKLATLVLSPVSDLATRLASTLPVMVVASVAAIATWVVVRFVDVLFASVARRETQLAWVPADLAAPTSILLRVAIVVSALAFVAPAVTGASDGSVARTGMLALLAFALAAVPVLASATVGAVYLFGRRLHPGVLLRIGDKRGRLQQLGFLELRLLTARGEDVHVPSLHLLRTPLTVLDDASPVRVTVELTSDQPTRTLVELLDLAASRLMVARDVGLVSFDETARRFQLRGTLTATSGSELLTSIVDQLTASGVHVRQGSVESLMDDAEVRS